MRSRSALAAAMALACLLVGGAAVPLSASPVVTSAATAPAVVLRDPDGRLVNPFLAAENSAAIVFVFASVECPVSNRYAPTIRRLQESFAPQNVAFWMVYPNPGDTPDAVRGHLKAFNYSVHALLDPRHELVKLAKAAVTPEAAVFDRSRALAYHGRIDDKFVSLGVERAAPSRHDLADALTAVLAGRAALPAQGAAVGCYIADFVP